MKRSSLNALTGSLVAGAALVGVAQASCTQPEVACSVSTYYEYAATYTQVSGDDECPVSGRIGDSIGLASYNPPTKRDGQTVPDLDKVFLAARTYALGSLVAHAAEFGVFDENEGNAPHAFGPFDTTSPVDDICTATLEPARVELPEVPGDPGDPADPEDDIAPQPATEIEEKWSDVQVYVTAANIGTQMRARYKVTDNISNCSAEYEVLAMFPEVSCDNGDGTPNDDLCAAEAQPEKGIPIGSGVSPDYPVKCHPTLLTCVLDTNKDSEFPILIGGE